MEETLREIQELLNLMINKLEATDLKLESQTEEVKKHIEQHGEQLNVEELLMAHQKEIKTSIELLRDEIDGLHQMVELMMDVIGDSYDKFK